MKKRFVYALILLVLGACKKEDDTPDPVASTANGILICNEGNFNWGNGTLSFYDYDTKTVTQDVFKAANDENLGDVCQSAVYVGNTLYVVVNNSAKIEVLNRSDFKRKATISGFTSPRYMQIVSSSKAYVTDLYANKVWVVNLSSNAIMGDIALPGWTEEMAMVNDRVFVTNLEKQYLYVINSNTDALEDSVLVGKGAGSIAVDTLGNVWVTSSGDAAASVLPALVKVDASLTATRFEMDADANPTRLVYDGSIDRLYFLNGDVHTFDIGANHMTDNFIPANGRILYGLGIDSGTGQLFVSDAKDFVQASDIYIYSQNGSEQASFQGGINSGYFLR